MIRFAADEDLDNHILRGLRRRLPTIDVTRVQDVELVGASDEAVLAWAAASDRVLLTHDASTMTSAAYRRVDERERMPGVIIVPQTLGVGAAIDDLLLIAECSVAEDWVDQVRFLPLA
jgi:hypothetical protein